MVKKDGQETAAEDVAVSNVADQLGGTELGVLTTEQLVTISSIQPRVEDAALRDIASYEEAVQLAEAVHGVVTDIADELGTGFVVLDNKDKSKLVDVPMIAILWKFSAGDYGAFVSMAVVTNKGDKFIVNDGSTGIFRQLKELSSDKRVFGALKIPHGLRESEYDTCPECGKPMTKDEVDCSNDLCNFSGDARSVGQTYYLDTTPAKN